MRYTLLVAGPLLVLSFSIREFSVAQPQKHALGVNEISKAIDDVAVLTAKVAKKAAAGERVGLSLELKNTGRGTISFSNEDLKTFQLKVRTIDNGLVPKNLFGKDLDDPRFEIGSFRSIELGPGKRATVTFNLDRLFDLSLPGDYLVQVEARFSVNGMIQTLKIDKLGIHLNPSDWGSRLVVEE